MLAKIYVTPKKGVLDPQGKAVAQSLHALGFDEVGDVRIGKYMEITLDGATADGAKERIREMCQKLLANGVIEDFRFEISGADAKR